MAFSRITLFDENSKKDLMRKTKAFSYEASEHKHFKRLKVEARKRRPRVSESALLVEILKDYFERQEIINSLNEPVHQSVEP